MKYMPLIWHKYKNNMVSNRVKRNISATLLVVGILCVIARAWEVALTPKSGFAWFETGGMALLTYLCLDNFLIYRRRVKKGIKFGSH